MEVEETRVPWVPRRQVCHPTPVPSMRGADGVAGEVDSRFYDSCMRNAPKYGHLKALL